MRRRVRSGAPDTPVLRKPAILTLLSSGARFRACVLAATLAPGAFAQEQPPPASPIPSASRDTVIIVGQSDEPITVVPLGLSVSVGEGRFEAVNAVNVEDLM